MILHIDIVTHIHKNKEFIIINTYMIKLLFSDEIFSEVHQIQA